MIKPGHIFAIDFDGTCVSHEFPAVGKDCPYAVETIKKIVANGGKLILWTMRSNTINPEISTDPHIINCVAGNYLDDAINWFYERGIPLWGIQRNPDQYAWTNSPKAYAHTYIDDAALGTHCIEDKSFSDRPFVDWLIVDALLFPTE